MDSDEILDCAAAETLARMYPEEVPDLSDLVRRIKLRHEEDELRAKIARLVRGGGR